MTQNHNLPQRLQQIVEDFQLCEGREKVELLLEYSEQMLPLPDWLPSDHTGMDQVQECMTPVYVQAENEAGRMHFYFDVPEESPTVRGFAAIMAEGLDGSTPEQVMAVPADFFHSMGLDRVLTHQRLNGLSAILAHMKRLALNKPQNSAP
jgi:cysteine desulfuration protein SufE